MKKRILSLLLVVVMLITLVPVSVFAAGDTTITKQPVDVTVRPGQTASFTIEATNPNCSASDLEYYWIDADEVDIDDLALTEQIELIINAKIGEGKTLTFKNVTEDMDGKDFVCAVFRWKAGAIIHSISIPTDIEISDSVTLHVKNYECASHSLDTNLDVIEAKAATCAETGNYEYYKCRDCGRYYVSFSGIMKETNVESCIIPKTNEHGNISYVPPEDGDCCHKGHSAYYKCDICGATFSEETGTAPLDISTIETGDYNKNKHSNLKHEEAVAPTCCEQGNIEYWYCDGCGKYYEDEACTKTTSVLKLDIDKDPTNHTDLQHFDAVAATCTKGGNIEYWYCSGCKDYFSDPAGEKEISRLKIDTDRDKTNHRELVEYDAKAATCKEAGNIQYWYCEDCGHYYSDQYGRSEISKSGTVLAQRDHDYKWIAHEQNGVEWHAYECTMCGNASKTGSHTGGTATCTEKAVCETCGYEYGELEPNNHKHTDIIRVLQEATPKKDGVRIIFCYDCQQTIEQKYSYKDACIHDIVLVEGVEAKCESCKDNWGVVEHYKCTKCGTLFEDEEGEIEITDPNSVKIEPLKHYIVQGEIGDLNVPNVTLYGIVYNEVGHWTACKYCGFVFPGTSVSGNHIMVDADPTCCSGKHCLLCEYDDGQRDPENHVGGTELRNAKEPVDDEPGYTGDTYCLGCGEMIAKGRVYYSKCIGGCAGHLEYHEANPATCTEDGTKEYWECTECMNIYMDEMATKPGDSLSITEKALGHDIHPNSSILSARNAYEIATRMGWSVEDLIKAGLAGDFSEILDIDADTFLDNVSLADLDPCYDDECHWLGCQRCGLTLEDIGDELLSYGITLGPKWYEIGKKTPHTLGTPATCISPALCAECGQPYGELGDHKYTKEVKRPTCTENGYVKYICTLCKEEDTSRTIIYPALGHSYVRGYCERCDSHNPNPFYDVDSGSWYYQSVMWAYYYTPAITAGTDDGVFEPDGYCTRGQVVTFLWRAAGCPEPQSIEKKFYDVAEREYYYRAILWAAEQGITLGDGDGRFRPDDTVSRAEFVTFLWRFFGKPPAATAANPFYDVYEFGDMSWAYAPIMWAYGQGITLGKDYPNTFCPNDVCTRCEVVTFLYRAIAEAKGYTAPY